MHVPIVPSMSPPAVGFLPAGKLTVVINVQRAALTRAAFAPNAIAKSRTDT